jgi:hypothetical protein
VFLPHFWLGLSKGSALQLHITAGGSFTHKTTAKGVALLDCILENSSFTEPFPADEPLTHEEVSLVESTPLLLTYPDSSSKPSPEPEIMEEEEIQPLDIPFEFEEDLFEDYGNTSNYPHEKRPPVLLNPTGPLDKAFLKDIIKRLTAVMSSEWVQEGELLLEEIQIQTPSLTIPCFVQGTTVSALYNPTVGANIISSSFALSHLSEYPLLSTTRTLRTGP